MSLLTMCTNVANDIGLSEPGSVIGNTDQTAVRLLRVAHRVGSIMAKKPWELLKKRESFTTSASEPQYDLPADFRSIVPETVWNDTSDQQVFVASARLWSYEKNVLTSNYFDRIRLLGDDAAPSIGRRITLHPTPSGTETITFEYYSKNWLTDSGGSTERSAFANDSDVVIFDEDLFEMGMQWRMLKTIGQPYDEEKTDFDRQMEIVMAQDGVQENLHADGNFPALSNIPETGFG